MNSYVACMGIQAGTAHVVQTSERPGFFSLEMNIYSVLDGYF